MKKLVLVFSYEEHENEIFILHHNGKLLIKAAFFITVFLND
ncbi:hypothetical protein [Paenibacillus faecalis]|nr:hypothetical protein [Paenibacillus faecalis]